MKPYLNRVIIYFFLITSVFITTACTHQAPRINSSGLPQCEYTYQIPEKIDDGREISSLEEGVDSEKIKKLIHDIPNGKFRDIYSILLLKNGKIILEEYVYGYNRGLIFDLQSATKSIVSILVGIPFSREHDIEIIDGYMGRGYALSRPEELSLIRDVARTEGIFLDPVYTGKAFFGMKQELSRDPHRFGERIIFVHTGGIFGLFTKADEIAPIL